MTNGATVSVSPSEGPTAYIWYLVQWQSLSAASALFGNGLFMLLFILALAYLFRTPPNGHQIPGRTILRVTAIVLASFALVQVTMDVVLAALVSNALTDRILDSQTPRTVMRAYNMLYLVRQGMLALNNLVADALFLYRCKLVWGPHRLTWYIVAGLSFLILATAAVAVVTIYYKLNIHIPFGVALGTNVILLGLTAGRIWYKGREAEPLMGRALRTRWRAAVTIILESSLLYVVANVVYMASQTNDTNVLSNFQAICWGALAQVVNIVPMMMIVRVALGSSATEPEPEPARNAIVTIDLPMGPPPTMDSVETWNAKSRGEVSLAGATIVERDTSHDWTKPKEWA
uniref:Uncharacterized protein n=1 Tax=Mycena chlorophos TaxID=658473 RepID=A0ABQ0LQU9_MYCCL|nr:predicted protein [Mycena chlorophos]